MRAQKRSFFFINSFNLLLTTSLQVSVLFSKLSLRLRYFSKKCPNSVSGHLGKSIQLTKKVDKIFRKADSFVDGSVKQFLLVTQIATQWLTLLVN